MKTHSVRNKSSAKPIISLSPKFFEQALAAYPEAVALTLARFKRQYESLTGKAISLDYRQTQALLVHAGANASGQWHSRFSELPHTAYRIVTLFEKGFLTSNGFEFPEALATAQEFYATIAATYLK